MSKCEKKTTTCLCDDVEKWRHKTLPHHYYQYAQLSYLPFIGLYLKQLL